MADESVRVALRIRPQSARERIDMCRVCTSCPPGVPQVVLGKDKAFTYDYVYDIDTRQDGLYSTCVENLVERCFDGYNATIMAYGQTGAGKTFTMGTGFDVDVGSADLGVVPRAVEHIFNGIRSRQESAREAGEAAPLFQLEAEFMELYNEEIVDLFDQNQQGGGKKNLRIHEDAAGRIYVAGMSTRKVTSADQTMKTLKEGALSRTTASTSMNAQSSRSHAIFTLHLTQQRLVTTSTSTSDVQNADGTIIEEPSTMSLCNGNDRTDMSISNSRDSNGAVGDFETLTAKLHFVDLAGSERLKRTGATGDRAREGISINCGLLALGNVISALGDKSKRASHVPYRDSKLTRLLQDSLGGNSQTLMIACISPSDRDFMETLNTLKYANRARNIKNKVTVNQDKASQQISLLRAEIQRLNTELEEYKTGRRSVSEDGQTVIRNDQLFEISMLRAENDKTKLRLRALQETVEKQATQMAQLQLKLDLPEGLAGEPISEEHASVSKLVSRYLLEIENLKSQLLESESLAKVGPPASPFRRMSPCVSHTHSRAAGAPMPLAGTSVPEEVLHAARSDLAQLKEQQEQIETSRSSTAGPSRRSHRLKSKLAGEMKKDEEVGSSDEEQVEDDETVAGGSDNEANNGSESGTESSFSSDEDTQSLRSDLAELSSEISIKQRLIDQLQASQQQLQMMRKQYEEQMLLLQHKIKETESERDQVLANLESRETTTEDEVKKVRSNFEGKLKNLQSELGKMKTAKEEHHKLLRAKARNEEKLKQLQNDLQDMKKHRVKMMRIMREESARNREQEARRAREIQQLKKTSRKHENQIKTMEAERQRRENVLRRKNEEVAMLRRQKQTSAPSASTRPMAAPRTSSAPSSASSSVSFSRTGSSASVSSVTSNNGNDSALKRSRRKSSIFSTTGGKRKWQRLERMVQDAVSQRQTLGSMEQDMDRLFSERDRLGQEVKECTRRKEEAVASMQDEVNIQSQEEQLEALEAHLEFVQSNIDERQDDIMALMESKDDGETVAASGLLSSCSMKEARYLLDHFLHLAISSGLQATQFEAEAKQLRCRLTQCEQQMKVREQMLLDLAADDTDISQQQSSSSLSALMETTIIISPDDEKKQRLLGLPTQGLEISPKTGNLDDTFVVPSPDLLKEFPSGGSRQPKPLRRRTASPAELLFPVKSMSSAETVSSSDDGVSPMTSLPPSLLGQTTSSLPATALNSSLANKPEASGIAESEPPQANVEDEPVKGRTRSFDERASNKVAFQPSPLVGRKKTEPGSELTSSLPSRLPRPSEDVFKRLTNDTSSQPEVVHGSKRPGTITQNPVRRGEKSQLLTCSHIVEGHSKAVLSVTASGSALFTGSQDRTAKIWDLNAGKEVVSLGGHANSVVTVCYAEKTGLVFTACQSIVKVWDIRDGQMKCVRILGTTNSSGSGTTNSSESVSDVCLNADESCLFTTCGNTVRVWDLNKFQSVGRLVGSTSLVSTLLVLSGSHLLPSEGNDSTFLATGARDHCVKVYEVNTKLANIQTAVYQLEPPHYDGVQSLLEHDGQLYSGSRDHSIKQWDLTTRQLRQSVNGAHNSWVSSLLRVQSSSASSPSNVLASSCRSGLVKLWQLGTCAPTAEITAHKKPINAMTCNDGHVFTASSDHTVKMWKYRE